MPKHTNLYLTKLVNLSKLKASLPALREPEAPGTPTPPDAVVADPLYAKKEIRKAFAALKKKYPPRRRRPLLRRYPTKEGSFTENERAALLRGVIDALRARPDGPRFTVWRKYGLSRLYFEDGSWLAYGPDGAASYGPDKTGTAYGVRCGLGLERRARKGAF
jgi:hypothetical protein